MGSLRFRRSKTIGGLVRVNISKSGVGLSTGVPGARVGVNSSGRVTRTVGVPGTGLYYRDDSHVGHKAASPSRGTGHKAATPTPIISAAGPFEAWCDLVEEAADEMERAGDNFDEAIESGNVVATYLAGAAVLAATARYQAKAHSCNSETPEVYNYLTALYEETPVLRALIEGQTCLVKDDWYRSEWFALKVVTCQAYVALCHVRAAQARAALEALP